MKSVALGLVLNTPVVLPPLATATATATASSFTPSYINIGPNNSPYCFPLKSDHPRRKFLLLPCASDNSRNDNNGDNSEEPLREDENKQKRGIEENGINNNGGVNENNGNGNGRPRLNLKWVDLLLDPDPDNVVAVGLTGVLAWASVQVLWQLFVISIAILLAALKYSFVAALLIFILITLL